MNRSEHKVDSGYWPSTTLYVAIGKERGVRVTFEVLGFLLGFWEVLRVFRVLLGHSGSYFGTTHNKIQIKISNKIQHSNNIFPNNYPML